MSGGKIIFIVALFISFSAPVFGNIIEMRHPIDKGLYQLENGKVWARLYWRFNDDNKHKIVLQVSSVKTFSNLIVDQSIDMQPPYFFKLRQSGVYYWRLKILDKHKRDVEVSSVREFYVLPAKTTLMTLASKKFKYSKRPVTVDFTWKEVENPMFYRFKMARKDDKDFANPIINIDTQTPNYQVNDLEKGEYIYKVGVKSFPMATIQYSKEEEFFVIQTDSFVKVPELVYPSDGEEFKSFGSQTVVKLTWESAENVQSYQLQWSKNAEFKEFRSFSTVEPFLSLSTEGGNYFWRVLGVNREGEESLWSPTRRVKITDSDVKILIKSPREGNVVPNFTVDFSWVPVEGCNSYTLKVSSTKGFEKILMQKESSNLNLKLEFGDEDSYYWFVACNLPAVGEIKSQIGRFSIVSKE